MPSYYYIVIENKGKYSFLSSTQEIMWKHLWLEILPLIFLLEPFKWRLYKTDLSFSLIMYAIDMTPKHPVLNMHNGWTNRNVHMCSDKQILVDVDTIVSFVIQSGQVSEGEEISVLCHVN